MLLFKLVTTLFSIPKSDVSDLLWPLVVLVKLIAIQV